MGDRSESDARPAPARGRRAADIFLLGFRNDLARERVLRALAAGTVCGDGHVPPARDTPFPHRLYAGLPGDRAEQVRAELERLGAQVVVRLAGALQPIAEPLGLTPPRAPRWPMLMAAGICLAVAFSVWRSRPEPSDRMSLAPSHSQLVALRLDDTEAGDGQAARLNQEAVELGRAGQYAEAVAKLREALRLLPTQEVVQRNLQVTLSNWGFRELDAGQPAAAIDRFVDALALGERPEILGGLGVANARARNFDSAKGYLEKAVAQGATDPGVLFALGESYEADNDRVRALEMFQRARDGGAHAENLDTHIERLAREVDAEWDFKAEGSRHFEVRFGDQASPYAARLVLRSLESAYDVVGRKLSFFPQQPTAVVLYADEDFHDITQTPRWAGAAFDGRIKLPVKGLTADEASLDRVVRHEYAHSIIAAVTGHHCPAWLNEGLAIWAEEDAPAARRDAVRHLLAGQRLFALSDLEESFARLPQRGAEIAYAQSFAATWFLIERYDERRIPRLLEELGKGQNISAAFAAVYPAQLSAFERQVAAEIAG